MAKHSKQKGNTPVPYKNNFAESIFKISYRFSLSKVFDDLLTMAMASCTQNLKTNLSFYEDEYLATIAHYKDSELRYEFPKAFSYLVLEMEDRLNSSLGNDVLGEFFEQNISNGWNGQFFIPYPICQFMSSIVTSDSAQPDKTTENRPLGILDPACGSGRMLLASYKVNVAGHEYYGIDIDRTCAKMSALILFLNGFGIVRSCALIPNFLRILLFPIAFHLCLLEYLR